jgi:L-methionine (R)-S-oxide reductase
MLAHKSRYGNIAPDTQPMPLPGRCRTSWRGHRYNLRPILPFYPYLAIMFTAATASIKPDYALLARQAASILEDERDLTANAAQFSAFIYDTIADLNWAGFYLVKPVKKTVPGGLAQELLVGPFQGKVACARIAFGRGVCGTSAAERRTIVVADVHAFPGHIACDSASNAEIVIPVIKDGELFGVFDIDSPSLNRFDDEDRQGLEALVAIFVAATDFK